MNDSMAMRFVSLRGPRGADITEATGVAGRMAHCQAIENFSQSVPTLKYNYDLRWLGFVGRKTGQLRIAPAGNVYHRPGWGACVGTVVWLYDIQPVAVEKECMFAKQLVQFRN